MIAPATTHTVNFDKPARRRFALMTAARYDATRAPHPHTSHITAIEEEVRGKLAAEIRQETEQFAMKFTAEIEAMREALIDQGIRTEETLQGIQGLVADLTDRLQSVARSQTTPPIAEMGLEQALEKYCQQLCNHNLLEMSFESHVNEHLIDPSAALTVFRIAQDALDHAADHHNPSFVSVKLDQVGRQLHLHIEDIGEPSLSRHGIVDDSERQFFQRMEERMADCEGQLQISRNGGSNIVFLELPLNAARSARAA